MDEADRTNAPGQFTVVGPYPIEHWETILQDEEISCVYVIFNIQKHPVRIGETGDLRGRLREYENYWWFHEPIAHTFIYVRVTGEQPRRRLEKVLTAAAGDSAIFNTHNSLGGIVKKSGTLRSDDGPAGYTGKKVVGFVFEKKYHVATSWRGVLLEMCNLLAPWPGFDRVLALSGRRPYFTKDKARLRVPMKIKDTDVYVEGNWSAESVVKLIHVVLETLGVSAKFEVLTE